MTKESTINFKRHEDLNGILCAYESGQCVPFDIKRVFTVCGKPCDYRGDHAHKACTQLLVCVSGQIRVSCDDGLAVTDHLLDHMGKGLLIPPGIWAKEKYMKDDSVLMVLCDRPYEEDDYIRDYQEFKYFVGGKEK